MASATAVTAVCLTALLASLTQVGALRFINAVRPNWHDHGEWMRTAYKERICGPTHKTFTYHFNVSSGGGRFSLVILYMHTLLLLSLF